MRLLGAVTVGAFLCAVVGIEDIRLGVAALGAGGGSEVLEGLSLVGSTEENGVGAGGVLLGELIESEALSSSGKDSSSSGLGELESADLHLGDDEESLVIEDVANNDEHFLFGLFALGVFHQLRNGDRVASSVGLVETLVNDLIELRIRSARQELVKFDQQTVIGVGSGRFASSSLQYSSSFIQVDSHRFINLIYLSFAMIIFIFFTRLNSESLLLSYIEYSYRNFSFFKL